VKVTKELTRVKLLNVYLTGLKIIARDKRDILMRASHCGFLSLDGNTVLGSILCFENREKRSQNIDISGHS